MDALAARYYRVERPRSGLMAPHRVDLAVRCHQCVSWCLKQTVRRRWSRIPPPGPAQRPLYSAGTRARIERLRASYAAGGGGGAGRPSGKSTSFSRTVPADSRYDAAMPSAPMASGTVTEPISVSAPPGATRNSSTMPAMPVST